MGVGRTNSRGGGGGVNKTLPPQIENLKITVKNAQVILEGSYQSVTNLAGTLIVYKQGEQPPIDVTDGASVAFVGTGTIFSLTNLVNKNLYTFRVFPYNDNLQYQTDILGATISGTPMEHIVFGLRIDNQNSNPLTRCEYTDNAIGMTKGDIASWSAREIFKDIRPCCVANPINANKTGSLASYYLNPNNTSRKVDGTAADITSGAYDVMTEFKRFGYKIETDSRYTYVKITDSPNGVGYSYRHMSRVNEGDRAYMYVGRYLGYVLNSKLRSVSGIMPTVNISFTQSRQYAVNNLNQSNSPYKLIAFDQITAIQCLFLIMFGSTNSQKALGQGWTYPSASAATNTGGANTKGMYFGDTGGSQVTFAGIEDIYGNVESWVGGLFCDSNVNILTAFNNFNDDGAGYRNHGKAGKGEVGGRITQVQGTSEMGFIIKTGSGSDTTYYADHSQFTPSKLPTLGGNWGSGDTGGLFCLPLAWEASYAYIKQSARLALC
ncbi:MAG: hypothetical protein RR327_04505 [Clostridia bacterium]